MKLKFNVDAYIGIGLFILSLIMYFFILPSQIKILTYGAYGLSPFVFPKIATLGIMFLSVVLVINSFWKLKEKQYSKMVPRSWVIMLFLIGYLFLIDLIGFLVASSVFLFALMMYLNRKNWLKYILVIFFFILINYIFFEKILKVMLPRGRLLP